jgi:hypothetical protein
MNKRLIYLGLLILVAVTAIVIRHTWGQQAQEEQQKREASYQSALMTYSETLILGITRKNVEGYLQRSHCVPPHVLN